jgi:hypothetical protein
MCNGVLQLIPSIQTNTPLGTYIPLSFVIIMGMIKEAIVDYKRFKTDRETNAKMCMIYDQKTKKFQNLEWSQAQVGQIIKIKKKEVRFPISEIYLSKFSYIITYLLSCNACLNLILYLNLLSQFLITKSKFLTLLK